MMDGTASEPGENFRLPRSLVKWALVGIVLSSAVVVTISIGSGVTTSQLAAIGYLPFLLASTASGMVLLVQTVRFRVILASMAGNIKAGLGELAVTRIGSQFVTMVTPSLSGGEAVRAAWLSSKGVVGGKALWISYFEVIADVYTYSALAVVAATYALLKGADTIALAIAIVVLPSVAVYTYFFLVPARRSIRIPKFIFRIARHVVGARRAIWLEEVVEIGAENFSLAAREMFRKEYLPMILKVFSLTIVQALLSGLALWIVFTSVGLKIDLLSATIAFSAVSAIASLPVSIGGSGLVELGVQYYLLSLYGFTSWGAVVVWRIASYQIILVITSVALILFLRNVVRHASKHPKPVGKRLG